LVLLPAAQSRNKDAITPDQMKQLALALNQRYDYVLIDCPAGIEMGFQNAIAAAEEAIVVTTPEISAVRDADRVIGLLEANDVNNVRLIVNRIRPKMVQNNDMMSVKDVQEILSIPLLGIIPDDEQVIVATNRGEPLILSDDLSIGGMAIRNIADRLAGQDIDFLDLDAPYDTLMNRVRRFFSR
jgi:septum site-determining protein MinD